MDPVQMILRHFEYKHLPENLQWVSRPFHDQAHAFADRGTRGPETTTCLRKLLEAKDCAVRAEMHEKEIPNQGP